MQSTIIDKINKHMDPRLTFAAVRWPILGYEAGYGQKRKQGKHCVRYSRDHPEDLLLTKIDRFCAGDKTNIANEVLQNTEQRCGSHKRVS